MARYTGLRSVAARQSRGDIHPIERFCYKGPSRRSMDFGAGLWLSCNKRHVWPGVLSIQVKRINPISKSDNVAAIEQGTVFQPKFDANGLLSAIVQDAVTGEILMFAFMDQEALDRTRETGKAHFHSRSRGRLWMKGESSGHILNVESILVDCDQDALVLKARPVGPACHTGARSCFYRALEGESLTRIGD